MLSIDEAGRVIHSSSYSKTVSPGIRVGFLAGPEELIGSLAQTANQNYISPNMLAGSLVLQLYESGAYAENLEIVNRRLAERRDALVEALGSHLPQAEFEIPGGGYFLWADLGEGADTVALAERARQAGAPFIPGTDFMLDGGWSQLRFSFASVPPDSIDEGVGRIASVV